MSATRQSNFEILRILAILMVITGHFIRQSGLLESEVGINGAINIILGSAGRIAVNIRTLPNLFCAFVIFFFFLKTDIGRIRLVNYFAKSVFAVYIVHQIPAFRLFLWKNICHANKLIGFDPCLYTLSIMGIAISILIAVTLLDQLRIFFHKIEARIEKGFFT